MDQSVFFVQERIPWTADDIALLKKLVGEGKSYGAIAARMGRSRNAVLGKSHRLNFHELAPRQDAPSALPHDRSVTLAKPKLRANSFDPAKRAAIQQALAAGVETRASIAARFDTTLHIVRDIATDMGGLGRRAHKRSVDDAVLRERLKRKAFAATPPVQGYRAESFKHGYLGQQGRIAIEALQTHHCKFPIDMDDGSLRYCGAQREDSSSYCPAHAARCFNSWATQASSNKQPAARGA